MSNTGCDECVIDVEFGVGSGRAGYYFAGDSANSYFAGAPADSADSYFAGAPADSADSYFAGAPADSAVDGSVHGSVRDGAVDGSVRDGSVDGSVRDGSVRDGAVDGSVRDEAVDGSVQDEVVDGSVQDEVVDDDKLIGVCKWFSDTLGYGFLTICEGPMKGDDVFVHYKSLSPLNSTHRTLSKGEYVSFCISTFPTGAQAGRVTGVFGGPLLCDHSQPQRAAVQYARGL